MSALSVHGPRRFAASAAGLRFGRSDGPATEGVRWSMKRNCSITPGQLFAFFLTLCVVSLAIGTAFWMQGATLVLPFAGLELAAVAFALLVYARHAADYERMDLRPGLLRVECSLGRRTDSVDFAPAWVLVEPAGGDRSLIELSGQGQRVAIGRFVRPELRRALADELRAALRRCAVARTPLDASPAPDAERLTEPEA